MLSRIKNAARSKKSVVSIPYSNAKMEVAKLLEKRGVIGEISKRGKKNRRSIELVLLSDESGKTKVSDLKRVSRPSRRIYKGWRDISPLKGGEGFYIISAPIGIIDDKEARKLKVGGEILGEVW